MYLLLCSPFVLIRFDRIVPFLTSNDACVDSRFIQAQVVLYLLIEHYISDKAQVPFPGHANF